MLEFITMSDVTQETSEITNIEVAKKFSVYPLGRKKKQYNFSSEIVTSADNESRYRRHF